MSLINLETLDWNALKLAKSGRAVKLFYNKEPVQICTSSLYSPFGVNSVNKDWSNFTEYYIDCSVNSSNSSESSVVFRDFLDKLDTFLEKLVKENTGLFNNPKNKNESNITADDLVYTPFYKANGNYPKLIKLQLPRDRLGNFESFVFDTSKNKIKISDDNIKQILSKGKIFKCIIECAKVWVYNGKIGSIWNIVQLKFSENKTNNTSTEMELPPENSVYNTLMIDD